MDAFGVLDKVLADYQSFVNGFLNIKDDRVRQKVQKEIDDGLLWPEPWLALNPAFEPGGTVGELVDRGVLHPAAREIFRVRTEINLSPDSPGGLITCWKSDSACLRD